MPLLLLLLLLFQGLLRAALLIPKTSTETGPCRAGLLYRPAYKPGDRARQLHTPALQPACWGEPKVLVALPRAISELLKQRYQAGTVTTISFNGRHVYPEALLRPVVRELFAFGEHCWILPRAAVPGFRVPD